MPKAPIIPAELVVRLRAAKSIAVLTGAGISAESGVPTFRDSLTGHWARFRPEELATPEAFQRNPSLVWNWYAERRSRLADVQPNPGHVALARIEARVPAFMLATQNVDGLHHRAGSRNVLELHGNITRTICSVERCVIPVWPPTEETPPRCPNCRQWLRPDVVWFGEVLPGAELSAAREAAVTCDVFLAIGTSAVVYPAAGLIDEALDAGATVVEINPHPTPQTPRVAFALAGPAGEWLPALVRATFD